MPLHQIVYVSSAVRLLAEDQLFALLEVSRRNNARVGVTGMLIYWDGNFMQALEGEKEAVDATHARIARDHRHQGLITLLNGPIATRTFGEWTMGFRHCQTGALAAVPGYSDFLDIDWRRSSPETGSRAMQLLQTFRERVR